MREMTPARKPNAKCRRRMGPGAGWPPVRERKSSAGMPDKPTPPLIHYRRAKIALPLQFQPVFVTNLRGFSGNAASFAGEDEAMAEVVIKFGIGEAGLVAQL